MPSPQQTPDSSTSQTFWRDLALPFVESRRAQHSRACYRPHTHPELAIGAVDGGSSRLQIDADPVIPLQAGDVVVIAPQRVHSCNPAPDAQWSYQMLYLNASWLQALLHEGCQHEPALQLIYPARLRDPACYQGLCQLNDHLFSPAPASYKESLLIDFVGRLLLHSQQTELPAAPAWLENIRILLREQCAQDWPVAELAERCHLSRYHFIRSFRAQTGMTPHAYQLDCRINRARELLRQGWDIAELAYHLGFADQSHFQHAFKERVSATPGEYLRMGRDTPAPLQ